MLITITYLRLYFESQETEQWFCNSQSRKLNACFNTEWDVTENVSHYKSHAWSVAMFSTEVIYLILYITSDFSFRHLLIFLFKKIIIIKKYKCLQSPLKHFMTDWKFCVPVLVIDALDVILLNCQISEVLLQIL